MPENEIKIKEYNRIITDLNDHSPISFIKRIKIKNSFKKIEKYQAEKKKMDFTCILMDNSIYYL